MSPMPLIDFEPLLRQAYSNKALENLAYRNSPFVKVCGPLDDGQIAKTKEMLNRIGEK